VLLVEFAEGADQRVGQDHEQGGVHDRVRVDSRTRIREAVEVVLGRSGQ